MLSKINKQQRFSLLLLGEGEIYYEEFICTHFQGKNKHPLKGSMHFCSQSLIFVPDDIRIGILKFTFEQMLKDSLTEFSSNHEIFKSYDSLISFNCKQVIEMKNDSKNHPYNFIKNDGKEKFIFSLKFIKVEDFKHKVNPIFYLWKYGKSKTDIFNELKEDFNLKKQNSGFDLTQIEDFREQKIKESVGYMVSPLVEVPGRIYLSNQRIYFQPFYNIGSSTPVQKYALKDIIRVVKRRYVMRQIGFEIFTQTSSIFICVRTVEERDLFYDLILKQESFQADSIFDLSNMTKKWQNGSISNFDYLMYLNFIADRTFNDLTQYPVFPWVISNYKSDTLDLNYRGNFRDLSNPIGALNHKRLEQFQQRYKQMWGNEKFLYGTHYSCPGYILYFLVRQAPEYMLHLQNGKFDEPDRSFYSIPETWDSVLINPTDLKELIPEFYQSNGDFLLNTSSLPLGTKSNGKKINNVVLPPWAKDSKDFIYQNRMALESEIVSSTLHHWIDLIFGYKQRGEQAEKSNNLFHHLTYEGAVDLEKLSPKDRIGIETQIREFGQCPKQIFKNPHPSKQNTKPFEVSKSKVTLSNNISLSSIFLSKSIGSSSSGDDENLKSTSGYFDFNSLKPSDNKLEIESSVLYKHVKIEKNYLTNLSNLTVNQTINLHKDAITSCYLKKGIIYTASLDSSVKIYSLEKKRQLRRITDMGDNGISSITMNNDSSKSILIAGSKDENIYVYSLDFGKILDTLSAHTDDVTAVQYSKGQLLSGSKDSSVRVWKSYSNGSFAKVPTIEFEEHESEVSCLNFDNTGNIAVSGGTDGVILLYDLRSKQSIKKFVGHNHKVSSISFLGNDGNRMISCSYDKSIRIHDTQGNVLSSFDANEPLNCLFTEGNTVLTGGREGDLKLWSIKDNKFVKSYKDHNAPISTIFVSDDGNSVVTGDIKGNLVYYKK